MNARTHLRGLTEDARDHLLRTYRSLGKVAGEIVGADADPGEFLHALDSLAQLQFTLEDIQRVADDEEAAAKAEEARQ